MPLAEAKALLGKPHSHKDSPLIIENTPEINLQMLKRLAWHSQKFSPVVGLAEQTAPDCLFFDITGVAPIFGGEEQLARLVQGDCHRQGYRSRIGVAETLGSAWAFAHFETESPCVVSSGRQEKALRPLPIRALRISSSIEKALRGVGIVSIGQLLNLPREEFPSRFGKQLSLRIDQALGNQVELITPEQPPKLIELDWKLDPPTDQRAVWSYVLKMLLDRIVKQLQQQWQSVRRLKCRWDQERGDHEITLELVRSDINVNELLELVELQLARSPIQGQVSRISVLVLSTIPTKFHNQRMFDAEGTGRHQSATLTLLDRLSSRLGTELVLRPSLQPEYQPEFVVKYVSWSDWHLNSSENSDVPSRPNPFSTRPLVLKAKPQPVSVLSTFPCGVPFQLIWQRQQYEIKSYWGPERIATGWWRHRHVRRDYYQIETITGQRFWLFQALPTESWWLHGVFD